MDSVESDSYRIGKRSVKGIVFADWHQLPEAIAGIPETRNTSPACRDRGALRKVFMNHVIHVRPVLLSRLNTTVAGSLIQGAVAYCTAGKTGEIRRRR